uniref:Putative ixodes 8-cys protein n=1 Tax=Ixodes ricinus TaxID=34613 RepID=A0A0K8RDC1_IXORI
MARLIGIFLVILLAYQCADVVFGAVAEKDIPGFVPHKKSFLEKLKDLCHKSYRTRVVAALNLRRCTVTCATSVLPGIFGAPDTVTLKSYEPCDWNAQCMDKQGCVYIA